MAETKRPRKITAFNTTGVPHVFNEAGAFVFPGEARTADPNDPITQALLTAGSLIVKEG